MQTEEVNTRMGILVLPIPPSNNSYKRHYCTRSTRYDKHAISATLTARARDFKKEAGQRARYEAGLRFEESGEFRVEVDVFQTHKQIKDHTLVDLDNIPKVLSDALNGVVWKDDKQVAEWHLRRYIVPNDPHIEVRISFIG